METINLKEILDGELIDSPPLNASEKYEFAMALTHALAARFKEYGISPDEWDRITDNYLSYLIDNFPIEVNIAAATTAFRVHNIDFNAGTDTFARFYKEITPWLLSGDADFPASLDAIKINNLAVT